jgi:DNA-binding protein H-NS
MSQDLSHLSLEELHALATRAQKALEEKRKENRKAVIAQIKELADSIGVSVTITDGDKPISARKEYPY